jgi:hypothetical protein
MTPADCLALRIPDLGVAILRRLSGLDETYLNSHNFTIWTVDGNDGWFASAPPVSTSVYGLGADRRTEREKLKARLRQAWTWLETEGYVVADPNQRGSHFKRLTPEGEAIANDPDADAALRRVRAANQLSIDLHPRLRAAGVQQTFRAGDLDSAIRDAFADLEDAVRSLANLTPSDYGVNLMSKAFAKNGPLAAGIDPRHQVGMQRLFEGAFAILRNPAGHGPTELDVEEALEEVLHADLLMRKLATIASSLGKTL